MTAGPQYWCGWYDGTATVRRGSTGNVVREVQCILNYWRDIDVLVVDGIFGAKTEEYVKFFQENCGIEVDGIVGPHTWNCLRYVV
ncbi:peptidoglycan-binding domain-containing protein [Streptomyces umbrinus]